MVAVTPRRPRLAWSHMVCWYRRRSSGVLRRATTCRGDGEPTCRRDSVPGEPGGDHPSSRPTRGCPVTRADGSPVPLLGLAPGGVYQPPGSPRTLVRSYRTVSPLPVTPGEPVAHRRSVLCCTSVRSPRPGSHQLRTLWSPDLPQPTAHAPTTAVTRSAHRRVESTRPDRTTSGPGS